MCDGSSGNRTATAIATGTMTAIATIKGWHERGIAGRHEGMAAACWLRAWSGLQVKLNQGREHRPGVQVQGQSHPIFVATVLRTLALGLTLTSALSPTLARVHPFILSVHHLVDSAQRQPKPLRYMR